MAKPTTKKPKKTFYCLTIKKGRQFIKVDISHTPSICKTTRDIWESKGYTCKLFLYESVNHPLRNILRRIANSKYKNEAYI